MEDWKLIDGSDGIYWISSIGRVAKISSGKVRFMEFRYKGKNEYYNINLGFPINKTFRVHRLQMLHFFPIENPEKFEINHKNGIKYDNRLENLEWCTNRENQLHKYRVLGQSGYYKNKFGKLSKRANIIGQYTPNGTLLKKFYGTREASKETGVIRSSILLCIRGKYSHAGGFVWKNLGKHIHR